MGGFDIHFQALKDCGAAAYRLAKDFEQAYGELKPAKGTGLFGSLDGASALDAQVAKVEEDLVKKEYGAAAERLRAVENALDRVETNVRAANAASGG
ncbi:hypothetical protein [Nonomuraea longicatena]|uniref:Uncharacterized protein n=1 Tax=Nonomuraea longicatena TaxID=83682 RepID=A0ABN1P6I6_9ACTN